MRIARLGQYILTVSYRGKMRDAHPTALKLFWKLLMIIGYKAPVMFSKSKKQSFVLT